MKFMGNVVVILILIAIVILALFPTVKHFKGQGSCCGGGSAARSTEARCNKACLSAASRICGEGCAVQGEKSPLKSIISKKLVYIDGMKCDSCAKRAAGAINALDGAAAKVSLRKKRAEVKLSREISDEDIIRAVESAGFSVSKIEGAIQ